MQRFRSLLETLVQREPTGVTPLLDQRIIEANTVTLQRRAAQAGRELQGALSTQPTARRTRSVPTQAHRQFPPVPTNAPALSILLDVAATNSSELRMRQTELAQQDFRCLWRGMSAIQRDARAVLCFRESQ